MILLKTLQLNNFLSHEKTDIQFRVGEKILLDGKSGSGKSSITEAILWVLYGKGRSDNRSLVRRGSKGASVILKVIDGDRETIITRSITNAGKNSLNITQNTGANQQFLPIERVGIKDMQDWIEKEFLKASYELFTNSVAYPQENENSFVKANAAKRKDLLLEIIQAGNFDDLYVKARNAISENELNNAGSLIRIEAFESTIKHSKEIIDAVPANQKKIDEILPKKESLSRIEKDLEDSFNTISLVSRQISDKKQMLKMVESAIANTDLILQNNIKKIVAHQEVNIVGAREAIVTLGLKKEQISKLEEELKESTDAQGQLNAHLANRPHLNDYTEEIETLNKRLIPLVKDSGKCPSGDECPFVIPIKGQIDFLVEQIELKASKSVSEQEALERWEKDLMRIPPVKDITKLYRELKDTKAEIESLEKLQTLIDEYEKFENTLTELNVENVNLNEKIEEHKKEGILIAAELIDLNKTLLDFDANKVNAELSEIRQQKQLLQKDLENATYNIKMGESATIALKEALDSAQLLKNGIIEADKEKESLEMLKEALSPRGVKAVVIDYLVPQLEDRINTVLGQMSDFKIRLDTQKATADDEGVKEGLFITVINDKKEELPFASYSGGEKVKITVAISEALVSLQNSIGFRIMDENVVSLDRESTEGFVDVIAKLQVKFPQLILISHLQEVKDLFEKQIMIIKTNGISKIIQ